MSMGFRPAVVFGVAVFLAAAALTSCSSTPSALRSKTPPLRTGTGSASEKRALLTTADLQGIPGAPADILVDSPNQPNTVDQNPDVIGPCGRKFTMPASPHMAISEFGTATFNGFQIVIDVSVGRATAFVTAWKNDTTPGCPPSSSRTNTGSTQTQELLSAIPLPHLVNQETGALLRISNMGHTLGAYALVFRSGGRLEFNTLISAQPLSSAFGNGFALKAETELNASVGIASSGA
jgi:hypothetical protein